MHLFRLHLLSHRPCEAHSCSGTLQHTCHFSNSNRSNSDIQQTHGGAPVFAWTPERRCFLWVIGTAGDTRVQPSCRWAQAQDHNKSNRSATTDRLEAGKPHLFIGDRPAASCRGPLSSTGSRSFPCTYVIPDVRRSACVLRPFLAVFDRLRRPGGGPAPPPRGHHATVLALQRLLQRLACGALPLGLQPGLRRRGGAARPRICRLGATSGAVPLEPLMT